MNIHELSEKPQLDQHALDDLPMTTVFTARRSYASAVLGVVILSVCPSVCPSVRPPVGHTRAL